MKDCITLKTMKEIKIISNPIRMKVLRNYYAIAKPATVKQMAVHMGEVPANIHYHVKKLLEINILELHHTENVNGITAKFYVPVAKTIKIEDESDADGDGYIDEKEIVLSNIFDENKQEFIKHMRTSHGPDYASSIVSVKVNLTDDEYRDVTEYITNIVNKREDTVSDELKKEYLFFAGIVKSEKT